MRAVRVLVPPVVLAAAVVLALLASDVRLWQQTLASGDAVFVARPDAASWSAPTRLGGLAGALLGVGSALDVRQALQAYRATVGLQVRLDNAVQVQALRAEAGVRLARIARSPDPLQAAQARTLLGVLALGATARADDQNAVDAAASDFGDALRVDPGYEPAAFDLELLLRVTAAHGVRPGQTFHGGTASSGRHGAGAGAPGQGY